MRAPAPRSLLRAGVGAVLLAVALSGALRSLFAIDLVRGAALLPPCPFRWATGVPCPGCGMTRALLLLGQLRVSEALAAQPAAPLLLAGMLVWLLRPVRLPAALRDGLAGAAAACALAVWVAHLAG